MEIVQLHSPSYTITYLHIPTHCEPDIGISELSIIPAWQHPVFMRWHHRDMRFAGQGRGGSHENYATTISAVGGKCCRSPCYGG
jgi:hypothetical protein